MVLRDESIFFILQVAAVFWWISLTPNCISAYELKDTIDTLKEENFQLQHRLQNLTKALRELKHLLLDHSKFSGGERDSEYLHAWNEWTQHGISPETHHMLEQAFCSPDLHGAAQPVFIPPVLLFLSPLICLSPMLL